MAYEFTASRVSGDGNAVFPDEIIIDLWGKVVTHRKPRLIGCKETRIPFDSLASVSCDKHILFADIIIETHGGLKIIARGFTRDDADDIVRLLSH